MFLTFWQRFGIIQSDTSQGLFDPGLNTDECWLYHICVTLSFFRKREELYLNVSALLFFLCAIRQIHVHTLCRPRFIIHETVHVAFVCVTDFALTVSFTRSKNDMNGRWEMVPTIELKKLETRNLALLMKYLLAICKLNKSWQEKNLYIHTKPFTLRNVAIMLLIAQNTILLSFKNFFTMRWQK